MIGGVFVKKVGTITASLGFIYLGVWMVIRNTNSALAEELFKWWPIIIILLGVEILLYFGRKNIEERAGFNGLVVVVILLLVGINAVQFAGRQLGIGIKWLGNNVNISEGIDFLNGINDSNYKVINTSTTLAPEGKNLSLLVDNGDIKIRRSTDNNIKIEANIYVNKSYNENKYNINAVKKNDGYEVEMRENFIKKAEVYLYLPEGSNAAIDCNNVRVKNEDDVKNSAYIIKANNGSVDFTSGNNLQVDMNNGSVKVKDIKKVNIKCNNGSFNIDGDVEDIYLKANNGSVNINNKLCKNVDVNMNIGTVKLNSEDKNLDITVNIDHGAVDVNGDKKVNSSVKATTGTGADKVKIDVDNGTVTLRTQE